jgi:hypothetical protein
MSPCQHPRISRHRRAEIVPRRRLAAISTWGAAALRRLLVLVVVSNPAAAQDAAPAETQSFCSVNSPRICITQDSFNADVCTAIEQLADHHGLPAGFFARLIWQESRFDPNAVSPAGAQGIAQFIPGTARLRALADPFNPAEALERSAHYLAEMSARFGSLGLAAIGYNAGEDRARRFLDGNPFMPAETRDYVRIITGHGVESWRDAPPDDIDYALVQDETPFRDACIAMAQNRRQSSMVAAASDWKPWGVQVGAAFTQNAAARIFDRVQGQFSVLAGEKAMYVSERNLSFGRRARVAARVGRDTRAEGQALCRQIQQAGGFCIVTRN